MRRRKVFSTAPRFIQARFKSVCAETGATIEKGESCLFQPLQKEIFSMNSKRVQEWKEMIQDEEFLGL